MQRQPISQSGKVLLWCWSVKVPGDVGQVNMRAVPVQVEEQVAAVDKVEHQVQLGRRLHTQDRICRQVRGRSLPLDDMMICMATALTPSSRVETVQGRSAVVTPASPWRRRDKIGSGRLL
jgi:hypothetical protein